MSKSISFLIFHECIHNANTRVTNKTTATHSHFVLHSYLFMSSFFFPLYLKQTERRIVHPVYATKRRVSLFRESRRTNA